MLIARIFFFIGFIVFSVGYLWIVVNAFKKDVLWGLSCLFIAFVTMIFLLLHWDDCRRAFCVCTAGLIICLVGFIVGPTLEALLTFI